MKTIIISTYIIFSFSFVNAQESVLNCLASKDFEFVDKALSKLDYEKYNGDALSFIAFKLEIISHRLDNPCSIIAYAKMYDYLFQNGFDVDFDYQSAFPTSYSIWLPSKEVMDRVRKLQEENNSKRKDFNIFLDYTRLNERYYLEIIKVYQEKGERNLEKDVDEILSSGEYVHPDKIRELLLFEKYSLMSRYLRKELLKE